MTKDNRPYYYLHTNGETIRKPAPVVDAAGGPHVYFDSPFVVRWWRLDLPKLSEVLRDA